MPENLYITADQLRTNAIADEADGAATWDLLAESVSRLFDLETEVEPGFYSPAPASGVTTKTLRSNGTNYLRLFPYIAGTITIIDIDGTVETLNENYFERDGYLIFDNSITKDLLVSVTARYGFPAVPADIQMACIEQGLMQWRRKDTAFAELSGVATAVAAAAFSPLFQETTKRYRGIYGSNLYFS